MTEQNYQFKRHARWGVPFLREKQCKKDTF